MCKKVITINCSLLLTVISEQKSNSSGRLKLEVALLFLIIIIIIIIIIIKVLPRSKA